MALRASKSGFVAIPLMAVFVCVIYGVLTKEVLDLQSFKKNQTSSLPPSKSPRDLIRKSSPSEQLAGETSHSGAHWISEKLLESGEPLVLPDGTVIKPDSPEREALRSLDALKPVADSSGSDLRFRLLERAGNLAVHGEKPWKSLVMVATAYHRAGNLEAREFWFERAIRLAVDPDDRQESSQALREVVKGFVSIGEIEQGLELIHRIPIEQYRDLATAEVVRAIAGRQDIGRALTFAFGINDAKARHLALRGVAEAQARFQSTSEAMQTVMLIPSGKSRDDATMRVAFARASVGDSAGAANLVEKIENRSTRDLALMRLADGATRTNGTGASELYLSLLRDPYLRDELLLELVAKQVARARLTEAQAAAARIETRAERAAAMELLVSLQVRQGDIRGAIKRARKIEIPSSRDRALQTIALQQVTMQGPPAARYTASLIKTARAKDLAYRKIAERTASLGNNRQIAPTIGEIGTPEERASALASVAKLQARRGLLSPARYLISEAEVEVQKIPEPKKQWKAMSMLATAHLETGDESAAMQVAAEISDVGLRDRTYQQLSRQFAGLADIDHAEETALAIQKESTREKALDEVARVVAGRTRATEALGRLKKFDHRRQQVKFLLEVARRI